MTEASPSTENPETRIHLRGRNRLASSLGVGTNPICRPLSSSRTSMRSVTLVIPDREAKAYYRFGNILQISEPATTSLEPMIRHQITIIARLLG